jgi:hypothetical protein
VHERGTFTELRGLQVDGDDVVGASAGGPPPALEAQKRKMATQFVCARAGGHAGARDLARSWAYRQLWSRL